MMFHDTIHNKKKYGIMTVYFKKNKIPVVVDSEDETLIKQIGEKWLCNAMGSITHNYVHNGKNYEIKLHELIMANVHRKDFETIGDLYDHDKDAFDKITKTVIHINKMGLDNRKENLIYDTPEKDVTKNMKKKQRILTLPEKSGISPNELPTYVWYIKPEGTHGERFVVNIGDIYWKTTSSKKVSLRYKLEEAKSYLRNLKKEQPTLFKSFSMNGDFNNAGEDLLESFYQIIYKAGYTNIKKISLPNATDKYLMPQQITSPIERAMFRNNVLDRSTTEHKKIIKILPNIKGITISELPENCYYRPTTVERGDYFIVKDPQNGGIWSTSTSKNISTDEKYKQLKTYLMKTHKN